MGIEKAAKDAGKKVKVPFAPGRSDATQDQTDTFSFGLLEPAADGFRNYANSESSEQAEELLVDKAQLLKLTAPEMTVLVGAMRVLGTNFDGSKNGVFTKKPWFFCKYAIFRPVEVCAQYSHSSYKNCHFRCCQF